MYQIIMEMFATDLLIGVNIDDTCMTLASVRMLHQTSYHQSVTISSHYPGNENDPDDDGNNDPYIWTKNKNEVN